MADPIHPEQDFTAYFDKYLSDRSAVRGAPPPDTTSTNVQGPLSQADFSAYFDEYLKSRTSRDPVGNAGGGAAPVAPAEPVGIPAPMPRPAMAEVAQPAVAAEVAPVGHTVKSPMVGTFYRASSPGGKPLVDIGSDVTEGEAICIIEAMKIMNEIEADKSGKVTRILCENGQAVEFGQPLFIVE